MGVPGVPVTRPLAGPEGTRARAAITRPDGATRATLGLRRPDPRRIGPGIAEDDRTTPDARTSQFGSPVPRGDHGRSIPEPSPVLDPGYPGTPPGPRHPRPGTRRRRPLLLALGLRRLGRR